jgi:hypothetical protein
MPVAESSSSSWSLSESSESIIIICMAASLVDSSVPYHVVFEASEAVDLEDDRSERDVE